MFWNGYCGPGFMGGPFFGHLFFMIVILSLAFFVGRLLLAKKEQVAASSGDVALDLLRQRYAAGEIDEDEYLQRRENLS